MDMIIFAIGYTVLVFIMAIMCSLIFYAITGIASIWVFAFFGIIFTFLAAKIVD